MDSQENCSEISGYDKNDKTLKFIKELQTKSDRNGFFNRFDSKINIEDFCVEHKYFLPLICQIGDEEFAVTYGGGILERLLATQGFYKGRQDFINQQDRKGSKFEEQTAIEIAILKNWQKMTEVLIESSADITFTKMGKVTPLEAIYSKFHSVIINQLNKNIKLIKDDFDKSNELVWKVEYRYRPIVGAPSETDTNRANSTDLLAKILRLKTWKRNEVLTHPLTRLFVREESSKIKCTIRLSIIFHVFWYLYSALIITSLLIGPDGKNTIDMAKNATENSSTSALVRVSRFFTSGTEITYCFYVLYLIYFAIVFIKEVLEWKLSPDKKYYLEQDENKGQWLLFIIVLVVGGLRVFRADTNHPDWKCFHKSICIVGILIASLLVQGQVTKSKIGGIYNILLKKAVRRFLKFLWAYSPLLISFGCVFNLLLHEFRNEFADYYGIFKVFTVFAGELDYRDTFYAEGACNGCNLPGLVVFIIFLIIVTIILHNILVALTVDDIQALKMHCLASHIAAELELIHILEAFWNFWNSLRGWIATKMNRQKEHSQQLNGNKIQKGEEEETKFGDEEANRNELQTVISLTSNTWKQISFQELPEKIKICIKTHCNDENK